MSGPRTSREALIAEMLGEVDALLSRIEALPAVAAKTEERISGAAAALADAGDKYRLAVTAFTEEVKAELTEYLERKAGAIAAQTVEEQRAAMQEAARQAFQFEAFEKAANLGIGLAAAAKAFHRAKRSRLIEHAMTALVASGFAAALVYAMALSDCLTPRLW
jgi:hypothetical protein